MNAADLSIPLPNRDLCFDPTVLVPDDRKFDVAEFIAVTRLKAPLSLIRDDMRALLEAVQNDLVSCVQRDFETFVSLGSSIESADALADSAREPLTAMNTDISNLVRSIDEDVSTLSKTLDERRALSYRIDALQVLARANDLLHKCERLLKVYANRDSSTEDALRLLERIAGENAQLSYTLSRAGNGSFVKNMSLRISVVRRTIRANLEVWLKRALFPKEPPRDGSPYDTELLGQILDAYIVAGMSADAEDYFRREVVAPFAYERIRMAPMLAQAEREKRGSASFVANNSRRALDESTVHSTEQQLSARAGSSQDSSKNLNVTAADALEAAEREVIQFLGERVMPIMSLCETKERLRTRLDFVGNAAWPQIAGAIASHMSSAFSPGIADVSHQSVMAGTRLFAAMEASVISEDQRRNLHHCQTTKDFWRHWNLPVYFQLRFQEITSRYDSALRKGPVPIDDSNLTHNFGLTAPEAACNSSGYRLLRSDRYQAQATNALIEGLRSCWSENVYLKPLAHRFLRLSLQLLKRYMTWVQTGLAGEWAESDVLPSGGARVLSDIMRIQNRVPAELSSFLRLMDSGISAELLEEIDMCIAAAVSKYQDLHSELIHSISDCLTRACVDNLQPLRGILATYRVSSKPSPTTHSPFIPKILRPLKSFLQENRSRLDDKVCLELCIGVAEGTTSKYYDMATELISSNKKSEETLRRLNIGRGMSGAGGTTTLQSTTDKVSMQLYLDVAKFRDEIEELGVELVKVPSISSLWNSVKRPDSDISREDGKDSSSDT